MTQNSYAEIIYTIKVKLLGNEGYKKAIPIIIRQKERTFNYKHEAEYQKQIGECCCDLGEVAMKVHMLDKYVLNGSKVKAEVFINNKRCGMKGAPVSVELFHKVVLPPNANKNRIKITKLIGRYNGKTGINPRSMFNDDISFTIEESEYLSNNINMTKANKYFKHKKIIPNIIQSMKSDYIICEYEMYVDVQFSGWSTG